jgi:hypothetical protein
MPQGRPTSLSSNLRHAGSSLLYGHPVARGATFKPSGDPTRDPPEAAKESQYEETRRVLGLDTREGRNKWDARFSRDHVEHCKTENRFWEQRRFQQDKSLRSKKRQLEREARRDANNKRPGHDD